MTDVKRLLDEASSRPWIQGPGEAIDDDNGFPIISTAWAQPADAALIVYAVNRLPDYEAAVDALQRMADWYDEVETGMDTEGVFMCQPHGLYENARAALRRLRGESDVQ